MTGLLWLFAIATAIVLLSYLLLLVKHLRHPPRRTAGWALVETWQQLALMYAATGQAAAAADATGRAASLPRPTARLRQASLQQ